MMRSLAIIGGGASGLCAAIEAARDGATVTVFERMPKAGKKLLATGNGRCNYANCDLSPSHYSGDAAFLRAVLTSGYADTEGFFRSLGVLPAYEDGRIYPRSYQAASVRDALLAALTESGATLMTDCPISAISKNDTGFILTTANSERLSFDAVILAGGGKAASVHGSDGSCYTLLQSLGHTVTPLSPGLVGLTASDKTLHLLKGTRVTAHATLLDGNKVLGAEAGEIQFTDKGVSGIPVLNLSNLCVGNEQLTLSLNLCHDISEAELKSHIASFIQQHPNAQTELLLSGLVPAKVAYAVMAKANIPPETLLSELGAAVATLCATLTDFRLTITGTRGFDDAQITCGGADTAEFDPQTLMSRKQPGLFACGELLNLHGDCGGYNLHLAWTTGRIAGASAALYLKN